MNARERRVRAVAEKYINLGAYASIEWLVLKDGRTWLQGASGSEDPARGTPLPENPIYRIYSMTKPVISAIALMLVEEGKLRLSDPVSAFLPEFSKPEILLKDGSRHPANGPMLIEHLLTHRSGLSYNMLSDCPVAELYRVADIRFNADRLADLMPILASLPIAFEPGTQWRYSIATDVLARTVEIIEAKTLQEVVAERISVPLGLKDTGYFVRPEARHRLLPVFGNPDTDKVFRPEPGPQQLTPADLSASYPADRPTFARGAHGLFSTSKEFATIASFLSSGRSPSGEVLLSRHLTRMLWTNRIPYHQLPLMIEGHPIAGYGFGLAGRVMIDPALALGPASQGEFGWLGIAGTFFWIDPIEKLIGLVMTQYMGSKHPLFDDMRTAVYQALG